MEAKEKIDKLVDDFVTKGIQTGQIKIFDGVTEEELKSFNGFLSLFEKEIRDDEQKSLAE